jgi:NAD(P)-dependent dehydrogenase (short-subunit alcohol dehydrogenase family)
VSELFDVSGKSALVTGGSRGIGLMIARGLVQAGARVIVSSRKSADVQGTARELAAFGEQSGGHAMDGDGPVAGKRFRDPGEQREHRDGDREHAHSMPRSQHR